MKEAKTAPASMPLKSNGNGGVTQKALKSLGRNLAKTKNQKVG